MPVSPSPVIANPSAQLKVVLKWAEAMSAADFDALGAVLDDDYLHLAIPGTLNMPPVKGRETFLKHYQNILPLFTDFNVSFHEVVEAPGRVVIHATADAKTKPGFPYSNEYIIIFHLAEQPDKSYKLTSAKEFVDSKFTAVFQEQLKSLAPPS